MLPLGLGSNLEFFQQKSYSDRLLIETSSELSCTVTRRQIGEIWVLPGALLIINGSDYLLLGLFLQGNLGITSHRHRLKRVFVTCAGISSLSLELRPRPSSKSSLNLCVFLPFPSPSGSPLLALPFGSPLHLLSLCPLPSVIFLPSLSSLLLPLYFPPLSSSLKCFLL